MVTLRADGTITMATRGARMSRSPTKVKKPGEMTTRPNSSPKPALKPTSGDSGAQPR
jgi:hypothetical protein